MDSQRGQTSGSGPSKIGQPQSVQIVTGSPSIPRTAAPQRFAPQGPVPIPVRLLTISKVFAPAWIAFTTIPLRILLQRQIGRRLSIIACFLASLSSSLIATSLSCCTLARSLNAFLLWSQLSETSSAARANISA